MRKFQFETFPYKQLVLWLVQLPSATLGGAQGEPAVTQVGGGGQHGQAGEAGGKTVLGGGQSNRVVIQDQLMTGDVTHSHTHPPVHRTALHSPRVTGGSGLTG